MASRSEQLFIFRRQTIAYSPLAALSKVQSQQPQGQQMLINFLVAQTLSADTMAPSLRTVRPVAVKHSR